MDFRPGNRWLSICAKFALAPSAKTKKYSSFSNNFLHVSFSFFHLGNQHHHHRVFHQSCRNSFVAGDIHIIYTSCSCRKRTSEKGRPRRRLSEILLSCIFYWWRWGQPRCWLALASFSVIFGSLLVFFICCVGEYY